eukprot:s96_g3.t1
METIRRTAMSWGMTVKAPLAAARPFLSKRRCGPTWFDGRWHRNKERAKNIPAFLISVGRVVAGEKRSQKKPVRSRKVVFLGQTGTGKTFLALPVQAPKVYLPQLPSQTGAMAEVATPFMPGQENDVPSPPAPRDVPPAEVCEACGNIFMPDSNFCRQCGAARKGTPAAAPAAPSVQKSSSFMEVAAQATAPNSSVHLQVLLQLGGSWLLANGVVALVLLAAKNLKFDYPRGWAWAELSLILLFLLLQRLQWSSGCYANRAQSAISMACFLSLSSVLLLLASYFAALQVYVMEVEFVMGLISLSVLAGQFILAVFAGHKYSKRPRDSIFLYLAAAVTLAALVTAWVLDLVAGLLSAEQMYAAFIAGLTLTVVSLLLAVLLACGMVNEL